MKKQLVKGQKGEIEFRRKLYSQRVEGKAVLDNEFGADGIARILAERMQKTFDDTRLLMSGGIALSPYVELEAERCQRSLAMENDLDAEDAAVDISLDMFKSCRH